MRIEYSDTVEFRTEGMAQAVHQRVMGEHWYTGDINIVRDGNAVVIRAEGVEYDDGSTLRAVEEVKGRVEELGREAAEYEWLRPMFE